MQLPVSVSHSRSVPSLEALRIVLGLKNDTEDTVCSCPTNVRLHNDLYVVSSTSHKRTVVSAPPETTKFIASGEVQKLTEETAAVCPLKTERQVPCSQSHKRTVPSVELEASSLFDQTRMKS